MSQLKVLYSPYGAFEMKSKYQKNFLIGTLGMAAFVGLIVLTFWLIKVLTPEEDYGDLGNVIVIKTVADLGPPPSIAKKPPQVKVSQPDVAAPKVGIPKPVADEDVLDEDVVLATREELAEIVAPDITIGSDDDIIVDIADDDYLPAPDDFVAVEIQPEMISTRQPEYPRLAKQAGITGTVWVRALISKDGKVLKAIIHKSSGTNSLDDAAIKAAKFNTFKPGIQNGRPVNVWVSYQVNFELDG